MGVEFDTTHLSKDRVTAWLGTSVPGHTLYGSTCYAKKSWVSGLATQSRLRDCQYAADHGDISTTSDDNSSQVESISNENIWTSTQSTRSTYESSATELTDYSESEDEKTGYRRPSVRGLTSHSSAGLTDDHLDALSGTEKRSDYHWSQHSASNRKHDVVQDTQSADVLNNNDDSSSSTPTTQGHPVHGRRRSIGQHRTQQPPCKLKRDTESTDHFVTLLIIFATRLVTAIWPLSASPPMMSSCFNGAGVLPLRIFIQETLRRSKTSYSTLQVALYYLILLKDKLPQCELSREQSQSSASSTSSSCSEERPQRPACRAMQCGRRMFLSALMLASKYLQDRNYSTRAWSKISGLRSNEINENEREYLQAIDFRLHMPKTAFDNWSKIVLSLSKLSKMSPQDECNFRRPGFGLEHLLNDLSSDTSSEDASYVKFSESWWTDLLRSLDSQLVRDSIQTDEFLQRQVSSSSDDYRPSLDSNLPTPPTSPESSGDNNFNDALRAQGIDGCGVAVNSTQPSSRAPSPAPLGSIPLQPRLPNLPTPVSTPGPLRYCSPGKESPFPASSRSLASLSALRSIQRHPVVNANLDRCPPPQPHAFKSTSIRCPFRSAVSDLDMSNQSVNASCTSPLSIACAATGSVTRSRASSLTSSISVDGWQDAQAVAPTSVPSEFQNFVPCDTSVKLVSDSTRSHDQYPSRSQIQLPDCQGLAYAISCSANEYQGSEVDNIASMTGKTPRLDSDLGAAETLLALAFRGKQNTSEEVGQQKLQLKNVTSCPRKAHKRTHSRLDNDKMQEHVRQLLAINSPKSVTVEDANCLADEMPTNRCVQTPTKCWAGSKLPVLNKRGSKRVAMQCPASEMAAKFLKPKFLKGILMAS